MGTVKEPEGEHSMTPEQEKRVDDIVEEMPDNSEPTKEPPQEAKVGYVVGINGEGMFDFQVFGSEPGLVELLGLHQYASLRIQKLLNEKQMSGDTLVHEVGKAVASLHQKLDALAGAAKGGNKLG